MLHSRLYAGAFEWKGRLYQGTHEPLVSTETWENVQEILDGQSVTNVRAKPLQFAFTGLITCGHCGCAVVAQMQRGLYIYYHCSGFKQKCPTLIAFREGWTSPTWIILMDVFLARCTTEWQQRGAKSASVA